MNKIIIILIGINLIFSILIGQTLEEYQELIELYKDTQNINLGGSYDDRAVTDANKNTSDLPLMTDLPSMWKKVPEIAGHWKNRKDYKLWLDETRGDKKSKILYGFLPDTLCHFGYSVFSDRDKIPFWQNLPAPDHYILGPGDEIEVSIWGSAQLNESYVINRDGNIYIDRIGILHLNGKSLKEAKIFLKNKFTIHFSTLKGQNPSTFLYVTLGELKSINVHFVGRVKLPGMHVVHPFSTVITGLIQSGGIDTTGSLRKIQVLRNNEIIKEIDLYDYLHFGNLSDNIFLRNNDVIVVPNRESTVTLKGKVYSTIKFESLPDESLDKIIEYYGGIRADMAKQVSLKRILPMINRNHKIIEQKTITISQLSNIIAQDGDIVTFYSVPDTRDQVIVMGQVKQPGRYDYSKNMSLGDILYLAGGVEDPEYLKTMYLDQIEIIRVNHLDDFDEIIAIDLEQLLQQDNLDSVKLLNGDQIIVHKNINFKEDNYITVSGEVNIPGVYSLQTKGESLNSFISRAGGLTDEAQHDGIIIIRDSIRVIWDRFSTPMLGGDSVLVKKRTGVVNVMGEVYNSGFVRFEKGRSLMSYVNSVGGITPEGDRSEILVIYPNGHIIPKRFLTSPKIIEGSTIVIHKKPKKILVDYKGFFRETLTMASTLAILYVTMQNIK